MSGKGGARAKSGPPPDPRSRTSERKGLSLTALPVTYDGDVPELTGYLPSATARHEQEWSRLWTEPQANAWARHSWMVPMVVDLVKWTIRSEADDAPVGLGATIARLRDDLGLTHAGMLRLGWSVAHDALAEKRAEQDPSTPKRERRLRSADAQ